jgi:hypothetical protein
MPHPPPCGPDENLWKGMCYPRPDRFRVENTGANYKFTLEEVPSELLPVLAEMAGPHAELHTKQAGPGYNVTITSIPHADASGLLKLLKPNDPNPALPE